MRVSHETIYKYVQGRGELRRELTRCLRSQRTHRKPRGSPKRGGPIADMVMISERPPEVQEGAVARHWEGDLIIGKGGKSAVGTLVERTSRFLLLLYLPNGHSAKVVEIAMQRAIKTMPRELMRSITWGEGSELARQFSLATGIPVYFCDPHSPWQ
ncbi:IS30 family transposase [Ferrimicrobium sp.]|uniref:IS30 family transposase n=1 Tax=Ferrimicrobium sp. TaxID=2926050 RepID=UPI00261A4E3D|nr:IS30 family transposase [Ferrimicrobium sp.]